MVRGKVKEGFCEVGCVRVIGKTKRVGADLVSDCMQDRFVVAVVWCPLVGGKEGKDGRDFGAGRYGEPVN